MNISARYLLLTVLSLGTALWAQEVPVLKQPIEGERSRELHTYDVSGLLEHLTSRISHEDRSEAEKLERINKFGTALANSVRTFIEPQLQRNEDVQIVGGSHLVATARPEQQVWISDFLKGQAGRDRQSIFVQVTIFSIEAKRYAALAFGDEPEMYSPGAKLEALRKRLGSGQMGIDQVNAPELVTYDLLDFQIFVVKPISYVKDFVIEVTDGGVITDPVVERVDAGICFEGQVVNLGDGLIGVSCNATLTEVDEPIQVVEIDLGDTGKKGKIQLPKIQKLEIDATAVIADKGAAVFPGPEIDGRHTVILLSARTIEDR